MSRLTNAQRAVLEGAARGERASFAGNGPARASCVRNGWLDDAGALTPEGESALAGAGGLIIAGSVRVTVRLTPSLARKLNDAAEREGVTAADVIRRLIDSLED